MNRSQKYKILVVDDSGSSLEKIKNVLTCDLIQIVTVDDGASGIKKAKANQFDLIILDIVMPGLDGFEVNSVLKNYPSTQDIPVVFLTSINDDQTILKAFEEGAMDYIQKPFTDTELKVRIMNQLELKRSKDELIHAKEAAERSAQVKNEFLANMSHEIRTPISSINCLAEILLATSVTEKQKEYINTIQSSTELLLTIFNDILDLSKLDSKKLVLEMGKVNIEKEIRDVVTMFNRQVQQKKLAISVSIDEEIPQFLFSDAIRIKQIYLNLISNAIKFTHNGSINIKVSFVSKTSDYVVIKSAITDTGIGISEMDMEKLFLPFSQLDGSISRKYNGNGLGLAVSDKLVSMLGGKLGVISTPGAGSTFHFDLKLNLHEKVVEAAIVEQIIEKPVIPDQIDVLLVEDNPVNQKILSIMFRQMKLNLSVASNGQEAVDIYKHQTFHIVFMDINMPVMDGFLATQAIRKIEAKSKRKAAYIIALTANAFSDIQDQCISSGMNDFVCKPFKKIELETVIQKGMAN